MREENGELMRESEPGVGEYDILLFDDAMISE